MKENLISKQIEEYITYKKGLGFQIKIESQELRRFAAHTVTIGYNGSLTTDIAVQWATINPNHSQWYVSRRLETVRTFAKYICAFDSSAQIPPKGMFGKCHGRTTPYIFTEREIILLMDEASKLLSPDGLRGRTVSVAIGLLWTTGMRPGEVCNLMNDDIDLNAAQITIKETKFSKNRILPIHETIVNELRSYINIRDALRKDFIEPHFLITTGSRKLSLRNFQSAMQVIRNVLVLDQKMQASRPVRLYDIRHSFACHTLLSWLKTGADINHKIIFLSTYLGHVKIKDTYWYLTGTPELMDFTSQNFERFFQKDGGDVYDS